MGRYTYSSNAWGYYHVGYGCSNLVQRSSLCRLLNDCCLMWVYWT